MIHRINLFYIATIALVFASFLSCNNKPVPKPKAYPKIDFPQSANLHYSSGDCPFEFDYPSYGKILNDSLFFNDRIEENCWLNIEFPEFNSTLHLTYKPVKDVNNLNEYIQDTRKLTYKHSRRADSIEETPFQNESNAFGMIYHVGGNAASSYQFFVTDKEEHFVRGSLYFNNVPNADSLNPVINFIRNDLSHMLETFSWK